MDARTNERARQALHAVVTAGRPSLPRPQAATAARLATLLLVATSLLAGIAGGLLRAGVPLPAPPDSVWLGQAAVAHAALMICGFLGTVIGIERAVAVKRRWAFAAPLASASAGLLMLAGHARVGAWLAVCAAASFVAVNVVVVRRQTAAHTLLLLAGALAWLAGTLRFALADGGTSTLAWWFAFLVMTIAAERLEMTRLMRREPGAQAMLLGILAAIVTGAAASAAWPVVGGVLYGAALCLLAVWLGRFDIARRTVRAQGLSRYMAVCLLTGYLWLAVAGLAWAATAIGLPARDAALHALGLGFIVSMVMGHAPVILPAVARIKLQFGAHFYLPLALLHLSLALRLGPGAADPAWRALGAAGNAAAILLFAATVVVSALRWRTRTMATPAADDPPEPWTTPR